MNTLKVIVMDVDGTLLNSQKVISPTTKETLIKAQQLGYKLILASGRPTIGMIHLSSQLNMKTYGGIVVSYNGGQVLDLASNEVLFEQALSYKDTKRILHHVKQFNIFPMVDQGETLFVDDLNAYKLDYESTINGFTVSYQPDLEAFIDFAPNKILTSGDPDYLKEIYEALASPFKDDVNCMFTAPFYVEYTAKGVDKANALKHAFKQLDIEKENIIAFGDAQNDLTMLQLAKIGVAMANAAPEVLAIADHVTKSNDEDGIAVALKHFIPELI